MRWRLLIDAFFCFPQQYRFSWAHGHMFKDYLSQHLLLPGVAMWPHSNQWNISRSCVETPLWGSAHLPPCLLEHEHGVEPFWTTWTMFVTTNSEIWAWGQPPLHFGVGELRQVCGTEPHPSPGAPTFQLQGVRNKLLFKALLT